MPRYAISHKTHYDYASPVIQSFHLLHVSPREVSHQSVQRHSVIIEPAPTSRESALDYFGNPAVRITLEDEHSELSVTALSAIDIDQVDIPDLEASCRWEDIAERRVGAAAGLNRTVLDYACYSRLAEPTPATAAFARETVQAGASVLTAAHTITQRIFEEFAFDSSTTDVSTPVDQVLAQKSGVCQDFAHLQIAALRALGLPTRYVSGYIRTRPPEGQERLVGADASHAWVSVWSPEFGWVDFDPTNNLINSEDHVTIAYGRDYDDVSPISGVLLGGGDHSVSVSVDVAPETGEARSPT